LPRFVQVSRDLKVLAAAAGDAGDHVVEIMAGANGVSSEITSVVDQCQGEGTPDSIKSVSGFLDEMTKATNTVNTTMSSVSCLPACSALLPAAPC
jgi:hypothetical protein